MSWRVTTAGLRAPGTTATAGTGDAACTPTASGTAAACGIRGRFAAALLNNLALGQDRAVEFLEGVIQCVV